MVVLKLSYCFGHCFNMFSNCQVLKMLFELLRVKLYRNDLKGKKNFLLAAGTSYRGCELQRVK